MKLGICSSPADASVLPAGAVDFIEANVQQFLLPLHDEAAFAPQEEAAAACKFPVYSANCFLPGTLKSTGPDADLGAIEAYAATAFERAARVGMKVIVFGSGGSRQVPEGFSHGRAREQFAEVLRRIAPLAGARGVTVVVEPLGRGECNFINTVTEGAALVREVNHPAIRLLADFYHMMKNEEDPASWGPAAEWLAHTHAAEIEQRTAPGIVGDDFRPFLAPLKAAGYGGALSLECSFPNGLATDGPRALATLRAMGA